MSPAFLPPPVLPLSRAPPKRRRSQPLAMRKTVTVDLPRPLGLVLEEAPSLTSPRRARVVVARVASDGASAGVVRVGDVVVATSATFGNGTWPARSLGGCVSAIRSRCGERVRLVLERDEGGVNVAPVPRRAEGRKRGVVEGFVEEGVVKGVEDLFEEFETFRSRRGGEELVTGVEERVRAWGRGRNVAKIVAVYERLKKVEAPLGLRFYNVLMWSFIEARAAEKAVDVFDELPNPNVECYTTYAKALSALKRPGGALRMLESMRARRVVPNVYTYNSVIAACVKGGEGGRAADLFVEMADDGVKPNVVSWNILINWHARKKKSAERLAGTTASFNVMKASGVLPNAVTYTTVMKSYAASGAMNKAEGIFEEMKKRYPAVVVDVGAYNTLLSAHANRLDWRRCLELLDEMQLSGGSRPRSREDDEEEYIEEDDGFGRGGYLRSTSSSRSVFSNEERRGGYGEYGAAYSYGASDEVRSVKVKPNDVSYSLVIKALSDARRVEIAHTVFNEMLADGVSPPPLHAIVSLMGGYASSGDFQRSSEMLKLLKGWGIPPNLRVMTSFMTACVVGNEPDLALSVFAKMKASNTQPDVVACTMLLRAYGMKGELESAVDVVKVMKEGSSNGVLPNIITYNELISCANDNGRPDVALETLQMALDDPSVRVNENTFQALVQRSAVEGQRMFGPSRGSVREDEGFGGYQGVSVKPGVGFQGDQENELNALGSDKVPVTSASFSGPDVGGIKGVSAKGYLDYLMELTRMLRGVGMVPNGTIYVALLEAAETCGQAELGMSLVKEKSRGLFRIGRMSRSEVRLYEESIRSRHAQKQVWQ